MRLKGIIVYQLGSGKIIYHAENISDLIEIVGSEWCPVNDEVLVSAGCFHVPGHMDEMPPVKETP